MAKAAVLQPTPVLAFPAPTSVEAPNAVEIATENSLLEIDREIDGLLEAMQDDIDEFGEPQPETKQLFELFCSAFGEKVDRMGRCVRVMEAHTRFCREESARMAERARGAESKISQIKAYLMYFLSSREITKMEGPSFTIRKQKNSQDSVTIENPALIPLRLSRIELRLDGSDYCKNCGRVAP